MPTSWPVSDVYTPTTIVHVSMSWLAIVVDDHSRVKLNEDPSKEGSDYVNASHIDVSTTITCTVYSDHCACVFSCRDTTKEMGL